MYRIYFKNDILFTILSYMMIFLLGISTKLSFYPYHNPFFIFFAFILFIYIILINYDLKKIFIYTFCFSLGYFSSNLYWIFSIIDDYHSFEYFIFFIIFLFSIIILSLYISLATYLYKRVSFYINIDFFNIIFLFPSILVLIDYLRSILFSGFTLYYPSHAIFDYFFPSLLPIGGDLLLNFVFYIVVCNIAYILYKRKLEYISMLIFLSLFILYYFTNNINFTQKLENKTLKVQLIGSNFSKNDKLSSNKSIKRIKKYQYMALIKPNLDLSIWPESTMGDLENIPTTLMPNFKKLKKQKTEILFGGYYKKDNKTYNTLIDPNKNDKIVYSKKHLIPFGEYIPKIFIPLKSIIPTMFMSQLSSNLETKIIELKNINLSSSICYELFFLNELRKRIKNSNIHINISDLELLDGSTLIYYMQALVRLVAITSQKYILYSVNMGKSSIIDKNGKILKDTKYNTTSTISHKVNLYKDNTPYILYGNKLLLYITLLIFIISIMLIYSNLKKDKKVIN